MPIGKNAIKRISNDGYSNIKASAPDMENSVVANEKPVAKKASLPNQETKKAPIKAPVAKKAPVKTQASDTQKKPKTKKTTATPKKSMEIEPELSYVKTAEKITKKPANSKKRQGSGYINIGGELPIYLL